MLTNEQADVIYEKGKAALNAIIDAGDEASAEQKALAKQKRKELTMNFIGQAIARIEERTAKFQEFIDEMEAVIAEFDPSTTIAGILQLKEVVDEAAQVVQIARQPAAASAAALPEPAVAARPKGRAFAPKAGRPAAKPARRGPKGKQPAAAKASKPSAGGAVAAKARKPATKAAKPAAKKPATKARPMVSKAAGKKTAPGKRAAARPATKLAPNKPAAKKPAAKKRPTKKPAAAKAASTRAAKRRG